MIGGIVAVAAFVILGLAALYFFSNSRQREPARQAKPAAPPKEAASPGGESNSGNAAMEKNLLIIHGLLHGLAENVGTLIEESAEYDDAMRAHQDLVEKAKSLVNFEEVERSLLEEVSQMMEANQRYRKQLNEANTTVKRQREELEKLQSNIEIDFLTDIPNRRGFDRRIAEAIELAKRHGTHTCLVVIDVDHFKKVNDEHGHLAGDRILRAVSTVLNEQKRGTDFLARYGGEEFVMLLPETKIERAKILAERAREKMEHSRFRLENRSIGITVSIGVGQVDPIRDTPESFFERVDTALYKAKQGGRNRVELA